MRIVIDLQAAQTSGSRNRGIGRYSLALLRAMAAAPRGHQLVLALNGAFGDSIDAIREEFGPLVGDANIGVWTPSGDNRTPSRRSADAAIREAFLKSLKPDAVHITSLFEGLGDAATTTISESVVGIPTAVTLYDLIPYIHSSIYLANPDVCRWYMAKLTHLLRADMLLGISQSACREAVDYLGFDPDRVVDISSDVDAVFRPLQVAVEDERLVRDCYGLARPFLMYTGGIDHRKNIDGLIRAYARVPTGLRRAHQLAVVCSASDANRRSLLAVARDVGLAEDELRLTGFVPEEHLLSLYNTCHAFVFPSWHEGFGLPALEAMRCGAAVIASDRSSLPEVVGRADALFDPYDEHDMAARIERVLADDAWRAELTRDGLVQAARFSWAESAERTFDALESIARRGGRSVVGQGRRPRLAFVSPLPPERSGIADYSAQILPELSRHYDLVVVTLQDNVGDAWVSAVCEVRDPDWLVRNAATFDRIVYQFGNSHYHEHMFGLLKQVPGVVVLHDFFLSGIRAARTFHAGDLRAWLAILYTSHGYAAMAEGAAARDASSQAFVYPCNFDVIAGAVGMIVHSPYSLQLAERWYGRDAATDWNVIPLVRWLGVPEDRSTARKALGIGADDFVVASFGHLDMTKLNDRLLAAWSASPLAQAPDTRLVFVGECPDSEWGRRMRDMIDQGGDRVTVTGWADKTLFERYLCAADVGVQLRTLSRGETSAAVLDCMGHRLATVVNANGSMADLPRDCVIVLDDEFEDAELAEVLARLHADRGATRSFGDAAHAHVKALHSPRACADAYAQAIERAYVSYAHDARPVAMRIGETIRRNCSSADDAVHVVEAIAKTLPPPRPARRMFIDVTRAVRGDPVPAEYPDALRALLLSHADGMRMEPVWRRAPDEGYRFARDYTCRLLRMPWAVLDDDLVDPVAGDLLVLHNQVASADAADLAVPLRRVGVHILDHFPGATPDPDSAGLSDPTTYCLENEA